MRPEQVYSEEDLQKLVGATAPGRLERALVMVPALTGLRIGEVLGLTWPAVDFKANKIHVRLNLFDESKEKGGRQLRAPKSKSSRRSLDLPQELGHELKLWKLKCPRSEQDLVFATIAEGKSLHRKGAMQIMDSAIEAAEVKRLTLHKLRHTFASLLLSRGGAIPKVSNLLGHRDSVITLKTYAHFVADKKNDVQELATSILKNKKEEKMEKRWIRIAFSLKNVLAVLISVCFSVYAWIIVMKAGYGWENALLGAIFAFGLTIQVARVWFGAFKFSGNKSIDD